MLFQSCVVFWFLRRFWDVRSRFVVLCERRSWQSVRSMICKRNDPMMFGGACPIRGRYPVNWAVSFQNSSHWRSERISQGFWTATEMPLMVASETMSVAKPHYIRPDEEGDVKSATENACCPCCRAGLELDFPGSTHRSNASVGNLLDED